MDRTKVLNAIDSEIEYAKSRTGYYAKNSGSAKYAAAKAVVLTLKEVRKLIESIN